MPRPGCSRRSDGTGVAPCVWALVPHAIEGDRLISTTYESEATKVALAEAFNQLGLPWIWQPVVIGTVDEIVGQLAASLARRPTVAFNLCDGLDVDDEPGLSLVTALEQAGIPCTGADSGFYETSTYKLRMKDLFRQRGVETAPWEEVPRDGPVLGICERLGTPLLVKPDVSCASCGISLRSKVSSDVEIEHRRDELRLTEMGTPLLIDSEIFVERFLAGDEFTVFVGGYWDQPADLWTLPPARRCFAASIPTGERFLTYERYWGFYREERPPADGEAFYRYELLEGVLGQQVVDLAIRAYRAVAGHGYARVDIRRDTVNGRLSVLEVNANCGLSGDEQTSIGSILALMGWDLTGLLSRIIDQTLRRHGG